MTDSTTSPSKRCRRCLTVRPDRDFASKTMAIDGRQSWCRDCQADYHAAWRASRGGGSRRRYPVTPIMAKAHRMVFAALERGDIEKSDSCENCSANGNKRTIAHHDDYDHPLVVRWLCDRCHREWHWANGPGDNSGLSSEG